MRLQIREWRAVAHTRTGAVWKWEPVSTGDWGILVPIRAKEELGSMEQGWELHILTESQGEG